MMETLSPMRLQNLHDWMRDEKLSAAEWGRQVGVNSRATAARYANGDRMPPPPVIVATYVLSRRRVPPNDWYDLPDLSLPAAEAA
jgi:hypothetical protein